MEERRTRLQHGSNQIDDPTYYLTNTGTGYTSLWKLLETAPSTADDTSIVTIPKDNTGYMKVIPGTENTTILGSLPTSFDGYGWRTDNTLSGQFDAGTWTFYVTLVTNKYVTGDLIVYVRSWKSSNADGSGATALTDWSQIASVSSPSASTTYNLSGSIDLSGLSFSSEYLFVEYVIATTSGTNKDTSVIFRCNEGTNQRIVTPSLTVINPPTVVTNSATNIGTLQATLNGQITDTGGATVDERGFEWGTESGSYPNSWTETGSFGTGSFSYEITDLQPKTTYYYRAKAHNSVGWGYGDEQTFTTLGYKIEGQCIDENGNPVSGAIVKLYNSSDNSYVTETTSNPDGTYSFTGLSDNNPKYVIAWKENVEDKVGTSDNITPVQEG